MPACGTGMTMPTGMIYARLQFVPPGANPGDYPR